MAAILVIFSGNDDFRWTWFYLSWDRYQRCTKTFFQVQKWRVVEWSFWTLAIKSVPTKHEQFGSELLCLNECSIVPELKSQILIDSETETSVVLAWFRAQLTAISFIFLKIFYDRIHDKSDQARSSLFPFFLPATNESFRWWRRSVICLSTFHKFILSYLSRGLQSRIPFFTLAALQRSGYHERM